MDRPTKDTDNRIAPIPAVVLAGAPADPAVKAKYAVEWQAEMPVAGKPMVRHVLDALSASSHVRNIALVGNIQYEGVSKAVPPASSFIENLELGMKACADDAPDGRVLVVTSDIPLITAEAVDDFIVRCANLDADFCYPIIPKEVTEQRFPGMRRTYARLAEGTFTGGNIVRMNAEILIRNSDLIREVIEARKSVPRLARLIGFSMLVRAVIAQTIWAGAIDLPALEKTAGRILKARVAGVETPYAEIGADVDDADEVVFAERVLAGSAV